MSGLPVEVRPFSRQARPSTAFGNSSLRKCAASRHYEGHPAGYRYQFFHFARHFPFDQLRIRWKTAKAREEAYRPNGVSCSRISCGTVNFHL
jgi:hypothetical protein